MHDEPLYTDSQSLRASHADSVVSVSHAGDRARTLGDTEAAPAVPLLTPGTVPIGHFGAAMLQLTPLASHEPGSPGPQSAFGMQKPV